MRFGLNHHCKCVEPLRSWPELRWMQKTMKDGAKTVEFWEYQITMYYVPVRMLPTVGPVNNNNVDDNAPSQTLQRQLNAKRASRVRTLI